MRFIGHRFSAVSRGWAPLRDVATGPSQQETTTMYVWQYVSFRLVASGWNVWHTTSSDASGPIYTVTLHRPGCSPMPRRRAGHMRSTGDREAPPGRTSLPGIRSSRAQARRGGDSDDFVSPVEGAPWPTGRADRLGAKPPESDTSPGWPVPRDHCAAGSILSARLASLSG
jgi:hypothetical protein